MGGMAKAVFLAGAAIIIIMGGEGCSLSFGVNF
jgi:hypothetical protein